MIFELLGKFMYAYQTGSHSAKKIRNFTDLKFLIQNFEFHFNHCKTDCKAGTFSKIT